MKHLIFWIKLDWFKLIASAQEIAESLHGIGLSKAQKIVEYKIRFGPIDTPEELLAIKGIGEKSLEKDLSKMITLLIQSPKPTNPSSRS